MDRLRRIIRIVAMYYFRAILSLVGFTVAANPRLLNDSIFLVPNVEWIGILTFVLIVAVYLQKRAWIAEIISLYLRAFGWVLNIFITLAFGVIVLVLPFATNLQVIGGIVGLFSAAAAIFFLTD